MQSMCLMSLSKEGVLRLAVVVEAVCPELGARRSPVGFPMWMKSFREGVESFAEPSAIAGRDRIDGDPMVAWVARATTERGEYELDEEADDPEDPPRPNTFLARAIEAAEEEGQMEMWAEGDNHIISISARRRR
ncbi:hypothetical protein Taro_006266 [Colocasia esculenta]|uniref:Uncharacterized protein n=1 Tax=Colocasia esculenta TaxID=4460 RepID=A0A843TNA6_COLES|nr:hypothetical protein [Colocasia esculenta]